MTIWNGITAKNRTFAISNSRCIVTIWNDFMSDYVRERISNSRCIVTIWNLKGDAVLGKVISNS